MEKRLNTKIEEYIHKFKEDIKEHAINSNMINIDGLLQFVFDYDRLILQKEDLVKRRRVKNTVPSYERCCAKRANGQQCTRRKKEELEYCGTHSKGSPHGAFVLEETKEKNTQIEVIVQDIKGILYYIDKENNVYDTEDVLSNVNNPRIIAKYEKHGESYSIPEFHAWEKIH
tara:strand:+ start:2823 stop:3338 length:516 start_codon:yes stop_codon:yes gene_type:complete